MFNLVDHMTRDNLDTSIITYDRNLIIMIFFMLCYVSWTSLIDLISPSIHSMNIKLMKMPFIHNNEKRTISAKGDCL